MIGFLFTLFASQSKAEDFSALADPKMAPDAEFSDALGQPLTFKQFQGQALLVNFWATWCPPCLKEMPSLNNLSKNLEPHGVKILAISLDREGIKKVAPFFRQQGLDHLKIYLDEKNRLLRDMKLQSLPSTYLIDKNGAIIATLSGIRDWNDQKLREEILMRLQAL